MFVDEGGRRRESAAPVRKREKVMQDATALARPGLCMWLGIVDPKPQASMRPKLELTRFHHFKVLCSSHLKSNRVSSSSGSDPLGCAHIAP